MGVMDLFCASKRKALEARVAELEAMLTPEMRDLERITALISDANAKLEKIKDESSAKIVEAETTLSKIREDIAKSEEELNAAQKQLVETNDEVLMQSFGLYTPRYEFATSTAYKDRLADIRAQQKEMVKRGDAVAGVTTWTVNGSPGQGRKMVKDMQKLLIRAFNSECDDCIEHVKFNNIEAAEKRIRASKDAISKLGSIMQIKIDNGYFDLKMQELHLAFEYQKKKQEEKEQLRQLRAEERERAKLEKEIAEARKKIEKEQKHYENALKRISEQLAAATDDSEVAALSAKKAEIEDQLGELSKKTEQIDYRAANQKAGYVYIISNIGAFGEGVYKIGMTRRLEPMDRIDELGDASVPFDFDVHALIFSEDAPALEAALHRAFEDRKLNMINTRREFFRVSLDEIKKVVLDNYDKTVEFIDVAPAEQYRESILLRSPMKQEAATLV